MRSDADHLLARMADYQRATGGELGAAGAAAEVLGEAELLPSARLRRGISARRVLTDCTVRIHTPLQLFSTGGRHMYA